MKGELYLKIEGTYMNKIDPNDESKNLNIPGLLNKKYEIFSSQLRLSVMLILHSYQKVKIAELQKAFNISSGKLEHHLNALDTDGLLRKKVDLLNKRALTTVEITERGDQLLLEYLDVMKDTLKKIN